MRLRQDRKAVRQNEAKERKQAYAKMTDKQKIDILDRKLGVGVGAVKQRARLKTEPKEDK